MRTVRERDTLWGPRADIRFWPGRLSATYRPTRDCRVGSVLKSPEFLAVTSAGILLLFTVRLWADPSAQILVVGILVSVLAGIVVGFQARQSDQAKHRERLALADLISLAATAPS